MYFVEQHNIDKFTIKITIKVYFFIILLDGIGNSYNVCCVSRWDDLDSKNRLTRQLVPEWDC